MITTELLNKLIKTINDINTTMQYDYIHDCMKLLNYKVTEQDVEKYESTLPYYMCSEKKDIYTHLIIQHIESLLTEEQLQYFQESLLMHYVAFTSNDKLKEQKINESIERYGIHDWQNYLNDTITYLIKYINDDEFILKFLNTYKKELKLSDQINLVIALKNNDDIKLSYIDSAKNNPYKLFELIKSIKDDEIKLKKYEEHKEIFKEVGIKFEELLTTIQSDEIKVNYLINNRNKQNKTYYSKILYTLQNEESYLKLWEYVNNDLKEIIIYSITDPNKKCQYIKLLNQEAKEKNEIINSKSLTTIITTLPIDLMKNLVEECNNITFDILPILKVSNDQEFNVELIKKFGKKRQTKMIRRKQLIHSDSIIQNIDVFLDVEEVPDKEKIKERILTLYTTNNDIVHTVDWEFLQDKYVDTIGLEKINVLASFPHIFENITDFTEHQYEVFYKCLNHYIKTHNEFDWNLAAQQMLSELHFDIIDDNDITQYVTDINTVDLNNLTYILLNGDIAGIKSQEDINNYKQLLLTKANKQIAENDLDKKRDAIFLKGFGLTDYSNMLRGFRQQLKNGIRRIYYLYNEDINLIENDELKKLFDFIKTVIECESSEKLQEIYVNITPTYLDTYKLEALLKNEYLKLYNNILLDPKTLQQNEDGLYDAGVDFNIITTSVGAYYSVKPENYKTDWNRPSLASPHFCASFIRNDMLGTAPIHNVLYGFSSMGPNSLALSGSGDIYSHGTSLISKAEEAERYYAPENQINNSSKNKVHKYNEMDFKRIQNGEKKGPDYILVFKRDGIIDNLEEAKKASADWDNLPIVVIDINKCLESEKEKLIKLINDFYSNPTKEKLEAIKTKIRNNQVIEPNFASELNIEELSKLIPTKPIFKPIGI